jgi:hypothetical protein
MKMNGELIMNHVESKKILDAMRMLAKGRTAPIEDMCKALAEETDDYHQMGEYSALLKARDKYYSAERGRERKFLVYSKEGALRHCKRKSKE